MAPFLIPPYDLSNGDKIIVYINLDSSYCL